MSCPRWILAGLVMASCGSERSAPRPDVVIVMLDTTRADHLGPFVDESPTPTPFLDRLAGRSIVFENAWTASTVTASSTASVFTGLLPTRHGVEGNIMAQAGVKPEGVTAREFLSSIDLVALPAAVRTLTEHLSAAGYQTLGIGANPNFCEKLGFARGFDHFSEHANRDAQAMLEEWRRLARNLEPGRPTFTYLHFMDPHAPYVQRRPWCPHASLEGCEDLCRYRSEISYLDDQLAVLFAEGGWLRDAVVVIVTDHGEEFLDHGDVMHRYSVHQELARAGLLLRSPALRPRRTRLPAHHIDLLPTLLALLGLPLTDTCDGIDLVGAMNSGGSADRPLVTCRADIPKQLQLWGLTLGSWRLIEEQPSGTAKLYDVESDPRETVDLASSQPGVLADLRARLALLRNGLEPLPRERVQVDMTPDFEQLLRQLGYAGDDH